MRGSFFVVVVFYIKKKAFSEALEKPDRNLCTDGALFDKIINHERLRQ